MRSHPQFWAYAALISVCFFWGTTYLTIRMALETIAPMTLVAARFVLSGGILLVAARLMGAELPRGRELVRNTLNGIAILGVGNGCLVMAETWIPSGLAALIITISPFWMVGLNAIMPPREKLHGPTLIGMAIGLAGAALLVGPGALAGGAAGSAVIQGFLVLQVGCFFWTFGSLLQRRQENRAHPIVAGGVQQLAAGLAFLPLALLSGVPQPVSGRSLGAALYLVVFGSIVGYSSYIYALDRLPVAIVSIYNYVNPVVAVLLGWVFYREPFGVREAVAMVVIFIGVAVVRRIDGSRSRPA
ncbi:MAG: EamA family transporter [Bryobacterales bacterium]|nr:EamA family transporter [Bryobacterales bacterium]